LEYGEYGVSATFNVANLILFNIGFDSRLNPFEEIGDDIDQLTNTKDPLHVDANLTQKP
jgi:hypothetical protein